MITKKRQDMGRQRRVQISIDSTRSDQAVKATLTYKITCSPPRFHCWLFTISSVPEICAEVDRMLPFLPDLDGEGKEPHPAIRT